MIGVVINLSKVIKLINVSFTHLNVLLYSCVHMQLLCLVSSLTIIKEEVTKDSVDTLKEGDDK